MFTDELNEGWNVCFPVFWKSFEVLEYCVHTVFGEQGYSVLSVLIEVRVKDSLVHEICILPNVEKDPAQVVKLEHGERFGKIFNSFLDGLAVGSNGKTIEKAVEDLPEALAVLKLHYLRWVLFDIGKDTYFMYQGIFDTDFDKYTEDAVALFTKYGVNTVFENLEGFPEDWKTNVPAFVKFVREHQCPSFLEYGEYPYVTADEIKKALKLKAAFEDMLDLMQ